MLELDEKAKSTIYLLRELGISSEKVSKKANLTKYSRRIVESMLWEVRKEIYKIVSESRKGSDYHAWVLAFTRGLADGISYEPIHLTYVHLLPRIKYLSLEEVVKSREQSLRILRHPLNKKKLKELMESFFYSKKMLSNKMQERKQELNYFCRKQLTEFFDYSEGMIKSGSRFKIPASVYKNVKEVAYSYKQLVRGLNLDEQEKTKHQRALRRLEQFFEITP